jgi:hypothetical protein
MPSLMLKIAHLLAFILLLLGLLLPWLRIPSGLSEKAGEFAVTFVEPVSTILFKTLILIVLLFVFCLDLRRRGSGRAAGTSPWSIGGLVLLVSISIVYPSLTIQRCAAVSARASWLKVQNDSMINRDGDTYTGQEYYYQPHQRRVEVKEVLPRSFSTLPVPFVRSFLDLHLAKLAEVIDWLGLSGSFCEFVGRGWFCAIFGSFLLSVSFMRPRHSRSAAPCPGIPRGYSIRPFAMFGALLTCAVCLGPVVIAGQQLSEAQSATLDGKFKKALQYINAAETWVPVLAYNTDLICQRGWLDRKSGFSSSAGKVFAAIREEEEGFTTRAAQHYADLLNREEPGPVWQEAFRGALRLALRDFNSGLIDRAASRMEELAVLDPTCVKIYYALQLADLRNSQKNSLERDTAKFEVVSNCFQSREKNSLIASAHQRVAQLDFDYSDIGKLGDEMRAAIKP